MWFHGILHLACLERRRLIKEIVSLLDCGQSNNNRLRRQEENLLQITLRREISYFHGSLCLRRRESGDIQPQWLLSPADFYAPQ